MSDNFSFEKYAIEHDAYVGFVNSLIAPIFLSMDISFLTFNNPSKMALVSLPVFLTLYLYIFTKIPTTAKIYRHLQRMGDQDAASKLAAINTEFMGWRAVFQFIPFFMSIFIYAAILISGIEIPGLMFLSHFIAWMKM